jgi:hypothetical protein
MNMDIKNSTPIAVAVAMSAPDVESQEPKEVMEENTTMIDEDDNAGKGMGIAMFVLIMLDLSPPSSFRISVYHAILPRLCLHPY